MIPEIDGAALICQPFHGKVTNMKFNSTIITGSGLPIVILLAMLTACGGGGSSGTKNTGNTVISTNGTGTVGTEGGTITTPDGVSVMLPAGALTDPATLRIAKDSAEAPPLPISITPISPIYEITPHIPQLSKLAQLRLPFDASKVPAGSTPVILIAEPGGEWSIIEQTIVDGNTVIAPTNHFSNTYVGAFSCSNPSGCNTESRPKPNVSAVLNADQPPVQLEPGKWNRRIRVEHPTKFDARLTVSPDSFFPESYGGLYCAESVAVALYIIGEHNSDPTHRVHLSKSGIQSFPRNSPDLTAAYTFEVTSADNGLYVIQIMNTCMLTSDNPDVRVSCAWVNGNSCGTMRYDWVYMEVNIQPPPGVPVISRHPHGVTAAVNQSASFTAAGSATDNLTIAWERSNDSGTTWTTVQAPAAVASSTYTLNSVASGDNGARFRAVFCDSNNSGSPPACLNSDVADLAVVPSASTPSFSRLPADTSVIAGQTASVTAVAGGIPAPEIRFFQVGASSDTEVKVCPAPGFGTNNACSYTTGALTESQSGAKYYAKAINVGGTAVSSYATVTVTHDAVAPTIVSQPSGTSTPVGGWASLGVVANGTAPLSYQWRLDGVPLVDRIDGAGISGISGSNAPALSLRNAQSADAGVYTVVVSNAAGSTSSAAATLKVEAAKAVWTTQFGDADTNALYALAMDPFGNVYSGGVWETSQASNGGAQVAYIAKHNASGNLLWFKRLPEYETVIGIASDAAGNVYFSTQAWGIVNNNKTVVSVVAKYDSDGRQVWVRQFSSADGNDSIPGFAADADGNTYIAGFTSSYFPGTNNAGISDAFVAKMDTDGTMQWVRQMGSGDTDWANSVAVGADGGIYIAGTTNGTLAGNTSAGLNDAFVAKYDADGVFQWAKQFGTNLDNYGVGVVADVGGNVYVSSSSLTSNYQNYDGIFISKIAMSSSAPALQWSQRIDSTDFFATFGGAKLIFDSKGNVVVPMDTVSALPGYTNAGGPDGCVVIYGADGTRVQAIQFGSSGNDMIYGIDMNAAGKILVGGITEGSLDGKPNAGSFDAYITNLGSP